MSLKIKWARIHCMRFDLLGCFRQGEYDGRGQQTASLVFTAIMSGRVGNSARELLSCAEQLAIIYSQPNFFYEFYIYYLKL